MTMHALTMVPGCEGERSGAEFDPDAGRIAGYADHESNN